MQKSERPFAADAVGGETESSGFAEGKGIVLPAHRRAVFEPAEVYAERIGQRAILYLDTNIWIELREAKTKEARGCREACERAVAEGQAIFPVSYASVSEVLENPSADARVAQADLMDALSLGVTLRNPVFVYALEGEVAYRHVFLGEDVSLRRREVYTSMPDYVGDGSMVFPEGWRPADVERLLTLLRAEGSYRSLRWLVEHLDLENLRQRHASLNSYVARIEAQRASRHAALAGRRLTRDDAVHEERVSLFNEYAVPAMRQALFADVGVKKAVNSMREFRKEHGDGSRRRFAQMFKTAAPSLELIAQLHARRSLDSRRKPQRQDFWDLEHASLAPVYADAFVTRDRGLADLLRLRDRRPPAATAALLNSLAALVEWLGTR